MTPVLTECWMKRGERPARCAALPFQGRWGHNGELQVEPGGVLYSKLLDSLD
ncbi:hypothetical protein NDU88_006073, partial [Pleurodeles waltl]